MLRFAMGLVPQKSRISSLFLFGFYFVMVRLKILKGFSENYREAEKDG